MRLIISGGSLRVRFGDVFLKGCLCCSLKAAAVMSAVPLCSFLHRPMSGGNPPCRA